MDDSNNNAKHLYKSKLDAIKHDFHSFAKRKTNEFGHNALHLECFPPKYNEDWIQFMKGIEKRVDELLVKVPKTDEMYLNLILIKSFCIIRIVLGLKVVDREKFIQTAEPLLIKCEEKLNPYKNKPEGVWLYGMNEVVYVHLIDMRNSGKKLNSAQCVNDSKKGLKLIEAAEEHYKNFVNFQMQKPWGINEIFRCYDRQGNQLKSKLADDFWWFRQTTIKRVLMSFSIKAQNEPKIRKYGIDGLKTFLGGHHNHEALHQFVRYGFSVLQPFTNIHYFKQAQHIMAVIMVTVVNFRRSLPPAHRPTVNPIQYDASYMYAEFGNRLVRKSKELLVKDFMRQSGLNLTEPHRNIHYDNCERLMPVSDELTIYEKQYPTKLTLDREVYKKMQKKILKWVDRMEELKETSTAPPDLCLPPWPVIQERLDTIISAAESLF